MSLLNIPQVNPSNVSEVAKNILKQPPNMKTPQDQTMQKLVLPPIQHSDQDGTQQQKLDLDEDSVHNE